MLVGPLFYGTYMTVQITKFKKIGVLRKATNEKFPFLAAQLPMINEAETVAYTLASAPVYLGDDTTVIMVEDDTESVIYAAVAQDASVDLDTHPNVRIPAMYMFYGVEPGSYFVAESTAGSGGS